MDKLVGRRGPLVGTLLGRRGPLVGTLLGRRVQSLASLVGRQGQWAGRVELLAVHRLPLPLEAGHLVLHPPDPYTEVVSPGLPPR